MDVIVTGGTGYVGHHVVTRLLEAGDRVIALARHPDRVRDLACDVVAGDVADPASLTGAIPAGVAIVHLVAIIRPSGAQTFERVIAEGTRNLVAAARAAGAARIVYVSAIGARADGPTPYFRAKWAAEEAVRGSGLPYVILRPSFVFGPDDEVFNTFARMLRRAPVLPVMGDGRYEIQPVAVWDLAAAVAKAVRPGPWDGREYDLVGPQAMSFNAAMQALMTASGRRRPLLHIPLAAARLQASLLPKVTAKAPISRDQLTMLLEGSTGDPGPLTRDFGITPTGFAEGLARYLR
jgi:uncharacterized protein YbjT (DUF2867 family)